MGTNALDGIRGVPMFKWSDMKAVLRQLRDPRAQEMYESIVVDTADIAYSLCEQYVCQQNGVQTLREIQWGGGFTQAKNEFQEVWREISLLGYGILFISHEKRRATEMVNENGEAIEAVTPSLSSAAYGIINSLVDIIGYLSVQMNANGTTERYLYTRATPRIFAGSRYKYIAPKISFNEDGYTELINAISDAIDKQAKVDNAQVTDSVEIPKPTSRPFAETMEEARTLWEQIVTKNGDAGKEKIRQSVITVFGHEIQLSRATEDQQDLVELVLDDMRKMV